MIQVIFALGFILACGFAFFRGRSRWKQIEKLKQSTQMVNQQLPTLVRRVARSYEAKFGRAPSVLGEFEGVKHQ